MLSKFTDASLPKELFHTEGITDWCPKCFDRGKPRVDVFFLGKYLSALNILYKSDAFLFFRKVWGSMSSSDIDFIDRDGSLGTVVSRYPYLTEVLASPLTGSLQKIARRDLAGPWSIQGVSEIYYPDAITNIRMAMKMLRSDRLADSIKWFKKAVEQDSRNVSARFGLGYALFYAGDFSGSIEQYRFGLEIATDNIEARLSFASVLHAAGMVNEEVEELKHIIRIAPQCAEAAERLSRLL